MQCNFLHAQDPNIKFKHLSLKEGLSQSPIFSITQDKLGFIWIGSRSGLTRFDGYEFKIYNKYDLEKPTSQRDINSIFEDDNHNLWLATSGGLYQFIRNSEKLVKIPIDSVKFTSALYPAGKNTLWIASDKGIKLLDCATKKVTNFISHQQSGMFVHAICKDREGNLWSGSAAGLRRFSAKDGKTLPVSSKLEAQLNVPVKRIVSIKEDLEGDIWFGTEDSGLFWYQKSTGECINFSHTDYNSNSILSDFVRDILANKPNELWIGTRSGLSVFNKQTRKFTNYEHHSEDKGSLSYNTIWKIMKDRTGSIWLTTYAGGLNLYHPINANFSSINERVGNGVGLNKPLVNAILGDPDGGIWVGTDGGGLNYIHTEKQISKYYSVQEITKNKTSNIVKGLARDKFGNLWLATLDGLAKFNSTTGGVNYIDLKAGKKIKNLRTNGLLCTESGIWIAGDVDGLKFWNYDGTITEYRNVFGRNSVSSNHINSLLESIDKKGIWIGTNDGLSYLEIATGKFTIYKHGRPGELNKNDIVISLFRDAKQRMWLGTHSGLRLFNYHLNKGISITQTDGLADNIVQAITEDKQGNIWVSTNNGISRITFKNSFQKQGKKNFAISSYTAVNGLSSNLWMANSVYRSASGQIFFGGVNGINSFDPTKIIKNIHRPTVVLTDFMIRNEPVGIASNNSPLSKPIESTRSIVLKYDQNSISFKFSALNFLNAQKNSYAYKMEGLSYNQDWNFSGSQRSAVYTGLEPGHYTFMVKAANNDGVWSSSPQVVKVIVLPPFWLTWWAYLFYTLVLITVFYFIVRFFNRQAKLERDLYYEHIQFERQQELHLMKLNFFTNISHEIRTPLTLIAAPIEKLVMETHQIPYLNKQLSMIQNNTNRLLKLINELMDFRKTETGKMELNVQENDINAFTLQAYNFFIELAIANNINYNFKGFEQPVLLYFDNNHMEKVLFNLLSNAFKFTPRGGEITLSLLEEQDQINVVISDNGSGIPFADQDGIFTDFYQGGSQHPNHIGTGIGLAFSKSIIDLHHGEISFISNPIGANDKQQTVFTVALLKGFSHFVDGELDRIETHKILDLFHRDEDLNIIQEFTQEIIPDQNTVKKFILVVEDNDEVREFIIESLMSQYQVMGCRNGLEGYETAIVEIPDLIITDVMMPEMDGMELCEKIKSDQRTNHIPVILLTARAAPVHQVSGLEKGADVYVAKPFSLQILQLNIRNLLTLRSAMQSRFSEQVTLLPKDVIIPSTEGKYLTKLLNILETNMENSAFGVAELACEIGMSQPVLYRKVKALTDLSVADFIKSIRLKRAAMLLAQNKMSIADVAFAVGFNNRKHFSKEFRKQFNQSPTSFIAEHNGGIIVEETEEV
ncbi:hybrid sensor histidine kinase/response regulator transcription factor [Pedobacter mucosus]|uniref:hybrid sensor histidine kinase/response regulator transcription factor n=1 Tax=Pedobacter mucosus TaxID=2895286 RepID=UPI001EE3CE94|nr:two-component regulator propeller domain-containing protein [Pedobacter mucosus]UKT64936.1 response regulator [Pedobacter mucosus]